MVLQCRSDIGILVIVNWVSTVSFYVLIIFREMENKKRKREKGGGLTVSEPDFFRSCNLTISVSFFTGFRMQKSCVWDLFLLPFLCLFCLSLRQLVVSCSKWRLLAFRLLLWANAWDRLLLGQHVLFSAVPSCGLGISMYTLEFVWNSDTYGLTEGLTYTIQLVINEINALFSNFRFGLN